MTSLFQVQQPFCIFAPTGSTQLSVSFQRQSVSQTSAGDTILSFISLGQFSVDLQPEKAGIQRVLHGQVIEIAYTAYVLGNPDLRERDRCSISHAQLEVVSVRRYGMEHAEIDLQYMGR